MDWDFWRLEWPNAAVVFALALVPAFAVFNHALNNAQRPSLVVGKPEVTALAMADEHEKDRSDYLWE